MEVYFDNSATTRVDRKVIDEMVKVMDECYGNPSSLHRKGVEAEKLVKISREIISDKMNVPTPDVYFNSCGSESNNVAIIGVATAFRKKGEIITTKIEHKSVLECFKYLESIGFTVHYIDVDEHGVVDVDMLMNTVNENTQLVSIMYVNNEVGSINPIADINREIKRKNPNTLLHTDCVQAFCKLKFEKNMADMISVSGHKIEGPKGIGAVYVKNKIKVMPLIYGGGQEKGIRSGTENVPGIVGFGKAAELSNIDKDYKYVQSLKEAMSEKLLTTIDDIYLNSPVNGSPYVLNVSLIGLKSEVILHSLEDRGVYVSSGSACSARKPKPSHVLTAMGLDKKRVDSSVRISFCPTNTMEEVEYACNAFADIVKVNESVRRKVRV